jgi:ribulose-phosphate 3-epimerase
MWRTVAETHRRTRSIPLPVLPAALRARVGVPELRRTLYDRAHVEHGHRRLQPLSGQHAQGRLEVTSTRTSRDGVLEMLQERRFAPSILSADFARLGAQVAEVMDVGARVIHVDVMDGHFVPPITIGPLIAAAIADQVHDAGGVLDVHLMIERPEQQLAEFARAGADSITIHAEATPHLNYALNAIRELGCAAAATINPGTPAAVLSQVTDELDLCLCMSVNPGWGGQPFIPASIGKLAELRDMLPDHVALEVDGGVSLDTAAQCVGAGANLLVAGSAIFKASDPAEMYAKLVAEVQAL